MLTITQIEHAERMIRIREEVANNLEYGAQKALSAGDFPRHDRLTELACEERAHISALTLMRMTLGRVD